MPCLSIRTSSDTKRSAQAPVSVSTHRTELTVHTVNNPQCSSSMSPVTALGHSSPVRRASALDAVRACSSGASSCSSVRPSSRLPRAGRCSWVAVSPSGLASPSTPLPHRRGSRSLLPHTGAAVSARCTTVSCVAAVDVLCAALLRSDVTPGCFFIGSIPATGIMVGSQNLNSTWAWRLPLILQVSCRDADALTRAHSL